jgi:hypothetical protein
MDAINYNWEKLPTLLALVFKKSQRDKFAIEPALLQLDVFILKCNDLFTLLNKQKPFFKYLCEKSSSYFEILGNQIDFSQTKMEPTVINDLRAIKNKFDFIFEKQIELVRGNETNRFNLQRLYHKLMDENFADRTVEKILEDFRKVSPFYECLLEIDSEMQAGSDVLINKFCKNFKESKFVVFWSERLKRFSTTMTMGGGQEISFAELQELETKASIEINFKKNTKREKGPDGDREEETELTEAEIKLMEVKTERAETLKEFLDLLRSIQSILDSLGNYYQLGFLPSNLEFLAFVLDCFKAEGPCSSPRGKKFKNVSLLEGKLFIDISNKDSNGFRLETLVVDSPEGARGLESGFEPGSPGFPVRNSKTNLYLQECQSLDLKLKSTLKLLTNKLDTARADPENIFLTYIHSKQMSFMLQSFMPDLTVTKTSEDDDQQLKAQC